MASNNFDEERDIGLEEGLGFEDYNFTPNRPRTKRRQFTPAFKTDIIKRIEEGESVASISRKEEIHPSNIFRWIENKEALFQNVALSTPRLANRSVARFPRLESELLKFVESSRKAKLGVTKKMIVRKAIELAPTCILK